VEHLNGKLKGNAADGSQTEDSDDDEEDPAEMARMKAAAAKKKTRMGVSAESYGQYNKKEDFKPKVVDKSQAIRE
jgi:cAMP-dependent protein kinase regulator